MANRVPLIVDASTQRIAELPTYDNLDLSGSNISNVVGIVATANITANYFLGNGSQLVGINAATANYANFAGNAFAVTGANVNGEVANANYAAFSGNVTVNAQPNITSVGTLVSLSVTGNTTSANFIGNHFGNGSGLSSLTGANVNGQVANANYAAFSGNVTVNAQPNITSVGNLTNLVVTGNIDPTNINLVKFDENVQATANATGTITPDMNLGSIHRYLLTGNITLNTLANAAAGASATLILTQDTVGNRLLTSNMKFAGNIKTLTATANAIDIMCVVFDGNTYYASLTKGYV